MSDDVETLSPNGNCLGVALLDAWQLSGLKRPPISLAELSTVRDAATALSCVRKPKMLIRPGAIFLEKIIAKTNGKRFQLSTIASDDLSPNATLLCMRSMRQLYNLPYATGHWIVVQNGKVHDRLWSEIEQMSIGAAQVLPTNVLKSLGPTFVV